MKSILKKLQQMVLESPMTTFIGVGLIYFGATKFDSDATQAITIITMGVGLIASKDA